MRNKLPPIHPGKVIAQAIDHLGLSQKEFAEILAVSPQYICDILKGRKGLSADICLKLPEVIGSSPGMWMRLQQGYDLKMAERSKAAQKAQEGVRRRAAALLHVPTRRVARKRLAAKKSARQKIPA